MNKWEMINNVRERLVEKYGNQFHSDVLDEKAETIVEGYEYDDYMMYGVYLEKIRLLIKHKSVSKNKKIDVYNKTNGYCWYCGRKFNKHNMQNCLSFSIDHIDSDGENNIDNLVPCCRSCNSAKGKKSIENFRGVLRNRNFKEKYGVGFNKKQREFLKSIGVDLPMEEFTFYFEKNKLLNT